MIDLIAFKSRIEKNKAVLISITEVSDLLLTELVGEEVLNESTKEDILAGRTRTERNKSLFEWLRKSDDPPVFEKFLMKLRDFGQRHIANLLEGTSGELPLGQEIIKSLQKMMRELMEINLESGLLESLVPDYISEDDYQGIKAEQTKLKRAKCFWDVLLRGSDRTFEKFKEEIVRSQPEMINLIEQRDGVQNKPHVALLKRHWDILSRCTDINLLTIAFLESDEIIDKDMANSMKSTIETAKRTDRIYNLLMIKSKEEAFDSFLQVMHKNEQKHVSNLLSENAFGQQPLSDIYYKRLVKIKPDLIMGMYNSTLLVAAMRSAQESADSDFAISRNDCEVITDKCVTQIEKSSALVDAVLRRSDFSFKALEDALNETKQCDMADFLTKGIMIRVDVKTTRTDKEEELSSLFSEMLANQPSVDPGSGELAETFQKLRSLNVPIAAAQVSDSILILTYCKRPEDARTYVRLLRSGYLQTIYEKILNLLLKTVEPGGQQPLEAAVILEEEERRAIQEFTGLDEHLTVEEVPVDDKSCCLLHGNPLNVYCDDCKKLVCSACVEQEHRLHKHSDANMSVVQIRDQLQQDLELITICRSISMKSKEDVQIEEINVVSRIEKSKMAVRRKCDELKLKVENFQLMLLESYETVKEKALSLMTERRRQLDSYVAVVGDFEKRMKQLMEQGTPHKIRESFTDMHDRAKKLQWLTTQQPSRVEPIGVQPPQLNPLLRNVLEEWLDPDPAFLEALNLPKKDVKAVKNEHKPLNKNKKLLDIISATGKCNEFISALTKSGQTHFVNYLNRDGVYDAGLGGEWPAVCSTAWQTLQTNRKPIVERLNLAEFLDGLYQNQIITLKQKSLVSQKQSKRDRNNAFLDMLGRGSLGNYHKTMEYIRASNQLQIAQMLGLPVQTVIGSIQFQVNMEKERMELFSVAQEVLAFRII